MLEHFPHTSHAHGSSETHPACEAREKRATLVPLFWSLHVNPQLCRTHAQIRHGVCLNCGTVCVRAHACERMRARLRLCILLDISTLRTPILLQRFQ